MNNLEDKHKKYDDIVLEQYKILFNILIGLADNLVKSILTIFLIFTGILAFVIQNIDTHSEFKSLLYLNYFIIFAFFYYLYYLRFRIKTQLSIVEEIEIKENYPYTTVSLYRQKTRAKFLSTKGLFIVMLIVLLSSNTIFLFL